MLISQCPSCKKYIDIAIYGTCICGITVYTNTAYFDDISIENRALESWELDLDVIIPFLKENGNKGINPLT